jgi:hypothetical protein
MRRTALVLLTAAILALAGPAVPQPAPELADPEANIVEALVVPAPDKGPAFWRIEDEDSTVYILGLPDSELPKGLAWDTRGVDRRLHGAKALIGGGDAYRLGLFDLGLAFKLFKDIRSKGPMEETLPPDLAARFAADRERLGKGPERYQHWGPMVAGQMLMREAGIGPRPTQAESQIRELARKAKVEQKRGPSTDAAPFFRAVHQTLTPQIQQLCLSAALDDIEAGQGRFDAAARGWAVGDVRKAISAPRSYEKCGLLLGGGPELWRQVTDGQATMIAAALETPGKTVAMVRLRRLLAKDGVIETLEARGIEVHGPRER